MKRHSARKNLPILSLKAEMALKEAVRETIKDHHRTGDPVVIWQDGQVKKVPAARLLKKKR